MWGWRSACVTGRSPDRSRGLGARGKLSPLPAPLGGSLPRQSTAWGIATKPLGIIDRDIWDVNCKVVLWDAKRGSNEVPGVVDHAGRKSGVRKSLDIPFAIRGGGHRGTRWYCLYRRSLRWLRG
jgi:hypothetical protein